MKRAFPEKPLHWVGSAKEDLLEFPDEVIDDFGVRRHKKWESV